MAQFEPLSGQLGSASLVFIAAEKRHGLFHPEKFLAEHPASFPFLLDEERSVTKAYGIYHRLGKDAWNIAHPATFVVDRGGIVRFAYVAPNQHDRAPMEEVLQAVEAQQ